MQDSSLQLAAGSLMSNVLFWTLNLTTGQFTSVPVDRKMVTQGGEEVFRGRVKGIALKLQWAVRGKFLVEASDDRRVRLFR